MVQNLKDLLFYKIKSPVAARFQKIYSYFYRRYLRKRLKNKDFTVIAPNCYAGIIYHRLGLRFDSPTINLFFPVKKQYLKFVSDLRGYLEKELVFIEDAAYSCPTAMLGDVQIVFNHAKTCEDAARDWNNRKSRVHYENLFVIFDDIQDAQYEDLVAFSKLDFPGGGKAILSAREYPDIPDVVTISAYKASGKMQAYLTQKSIWTGKNPADRDFDFVKWLNTGKL